ncbi:MAG TPA: hypothetical protein VHT91_25490 [Kofleriaceae bacterium]|jgi:hypothetical protein|nr:hypothetical protein [Kofleriaceae bacterium]
MTSRIPGRAIGLVLVLGSAAGCGGEEMFLPELGSNERVIAREAVARLANPEQGLEQPLVVGDLDGDGIDDAIVRSDFAFNSPTGQLGLGGEVFILYGGHAVTGQIDLATLPALTQMGSIGGGVAAVGDIDGDGLADFLVGIAFTPGCITTPPPVFADGFTNSGAFLVYGSRMRLTGSHAIGDVGVFLRDPTPCTEANSIAGLGDIDGDGKADFAIGRTTLAADDQPEVFVFYGRSQRLSGTVDLGTGADATIRGPTGRGLPAAIRAGDVDGDGLGDFLVKLLAAPTADLQLVRGSATRLAGTVAVGDLAGTAFPAYDGCAPGISVFGSALGDLDGDGADDFSLASCTGDSVGDVTSTVVHRVFYGRTGGLPAQLGGADAAATITTTSIQYDAGGTKLQISAPSQLIAGDVDGDGVRDLILADESLHSGNGGVHVIAGRGERLSGTIDPVARSFVTYVGQPQREPNCSGGGNQCIVNEDVGGGVSIGDLTGDHHPDLLIGASANGAVPLQGFGQAMGHTYVVSPPARKNP